MHDLIPGFFSLVRIGAETAKFGPGRRAPGPDFQPSPGYNVQSGGAFSDLYGMVELRDADHNPVPYADTLGAHCACGQKHFGGGAMRIFLKEVMLDRPHLVEAELVGKRHLFKRMVVDPLLRLANPRPWHRDFIEQAEFHGPPSANTR